MQETANHAKTTEWQELIEWVGRCDPRMPKSLMSAMRSLLTAMQYDDLTLMRSSLATASLAFADSINEVIQKRLGWPEQARDACQKSWKQIKGQPLENWDELGSQIQTRFDEMLKTLIELRDGPVKLLREGGYEIESAAQLENDIQELQEMKNSVLSTWPWSNQELPPVDMEMLNASMAAIKSGEKGERIQDLICRLGGKVDKD